MLRSRDWLYILVSLLVLVLGIIGMIRQINVALMPAEFPMDTMEWPLNAMGIQVSCPADLVFVVEGLNPGDLVRIESTAGSQTYTTVAAHSKSYLILATFSGLFFWVVAFAVFVPRLTLPSVTQFYWITMLYGLGIFLGGVYFQFEFSVASSLLNVVHLSCLAFLPAVFLDMTLVFPRQNLKFRHRPQFVFASAGG